MGELSPHVRSPEVAPGPRLHGPSGGVPNPAGAPSRVETYGCRIGYESLGGGEDCLKASVLRNVLYAVGCFGMTWYVWRLYWPFGLRLGFVLVPLGGIFLYKAITLRVEDESGRQREPRPPRR